MTHSDETVRWILLSQPDYSVIALRFDGYSLKASDWVFGSTWRDILPRLPDFDGCSVEVRSIDYVRFTFTETCPPVETS